MQLKAEDLFDLSQSIAAPLFEKNALPWQVLCEIDAFILKLGTLLPKNIYEKRGEGIWVAKSAEVAPSAHITGPCIIDEGAEIRHCAFIRGGVIVGKQAVVGNSTELKNCILFNGVQVPHFNYVGDSVLGFMAHMGAGAVTSNVKGDKTDIVLNLNNKKLETGLKKLGALIGDYAEIGCNSVLNPGTVLGRKSRIYPTTCVRGYVPEHCILKANGEIAAML